MKNAYSDLIRKDTALVLVARYGVTIRTVYGWRSGRLPHPHTRAEIVKHSKGRVTLEDIAEFSTSHKNKKGKKK